MGALQLPIEDYRARINKAIPGLVFSHAHMINFNVPHLVIYLK